MEGFLFVDKPSDMTSHDVIDALRRVTGIRKIGHAGTLDPFATGLLLVGVGRSATKEMSSLVGLPKRYEATFLLGASSTTDDIEGDKIPGDVTKLDKLTETEIREALPAFVGHIKQIPPAFSAVKIQGQKLYQAARKGEVIEAPPRSVQVHRFAIERGPTKDGDLIAIDVSIDCSSGTYIRALARDLGQELRVGGYVKSLRRTRIGCIDIESAQPLEGITDENWRQLLMPVPETLHLANKEGLC